MTKAMTGLVIADAVDRGEVRMDAPVATYLPLLKGSPAGTATMHELVTHTVRLRRVRNCHPARARAWKAPLGRGFLTADSCEMTSEARAQTLDGRGGYAYSTLGSAVAGQAVAAAAHMSYPDLMRTRLFEPLGMTDTAIEVDHPLVDGGHADRAPGPAMGHGRVRPRRRRRLHHRRPRETRHRTPRRDRTRHVRARTHHRHRPVEHPHRRLLAGLHRQNGQTITAHAGQTGGYASYLGIDRPGHKAVIVLSDVANNANDLGIELLIDRE